MWFQEKVILNLNTSRALESQLFREVALLISKGVELLYPYVSQPLITDHCLSGGLHNFLGSAH